MDEEEEEVELVVVRDVLTDVKGLDTVGVGAGVSFVQDGIEEVDVHVNVGSSVLLRLDGGEEVQVPSPSGVVST